MSALRRPDWRRFDPEHVTDEQLAALKQKAQEIDRDNATNYRAVQAAFDAYREAYFDFYGRQPEVFKRRSIGSNYVAVPVPPMGYGADALRTLRYQVERVRKEREEKRLAAERAEAQRREAVKADAELAVLRERYGLPADTDWPGLLDHLRDKNQYLDVAVAGMDTRSDWSEGFYRVSDAMKRFQIRDDRDKEIAADILGCMGADDGRVFRDKEWNYDALLELVEDKQLVADAMLARGRAGDRR